MSKWIPKDEKKPNENEMVLVTVKAFNGRKSVCTIFYKDDEAWNQFVTAWMPLPKPYTEDE